MCEKAIRLRQAETATLGKKAIQPLQCWKRQSARGDKVPLFNGENGTLRFIVSSQTPTKAHYTCTVRIVLIIIAVSPSAALRLPFLLGNALLLLLELLAQRLVPVLATSSAA